MSLGEILYLAMAVSAFVGFAVVLAYVVHAHDVARRQYGHGGESTERGRRSDPIAT